MVSKAGDNNEIQSNPSIEHAALPKGLASDSIQIQGLSVSTIGYPVLSNTTLSSEKSPPIENATNENLTPTQEKAASQEAQNVMVQNVKDGKSFSEGTITIPSDPPLPPPLPPDTKVADTTLDPPKEHLPTPTKPLPTPPSSPSSSSSSQKMPSQPQGKAPSPPQQPAQSAQATPASQPAAAPQKQDTWALEKFITWKKAKLVGGISLGVVQSVTFVAGGGGLAALGGALSATGVGAIVGVPLILVGAMAAGAGAYGGGVQIYDSVLQHQGKPTYSSTQQKPKTGAEGLSQKELQRRYDNFQQQLADRAKASASTTPAATTTAQSPTPATQSTTTAPQPAALPATAQSASAPDPQHAAPAPTTTPIKPEPPVVEDLPDDDVQEEEEIELTRKKKDEAQELQTQDAKVQTQEAQTQEAEQNAASSKQNPPPAEKSEEPKSPASTAPEITELPENEPTIILTSKDPQENLATFRNSVEVQLEEIVKTPNQATQEPEKNVTTQRLV